MGRDESATRSTGAESRFSTARPTKLFRESPLITGYPSATISPVRSISSRFCSTVLPNPSPGSTTIAARAPPAASAARARRSRYAFTSDTTSPYAGPSGPYPSEYRSAPGGRSRCISTSPQPDRAAQRWCR